MQSQNIGAGNTEIVLSHIFWILTKLIKEDVEASRTFRHKFAILAINTGLSIMRRNQLRDVNEDEEEAEKYTLALSILYFIKFASRNAVTR